MATFIVDICRTVTEECQVSITADTREEAEERAVNLDRVKYLSDWEESQNNAYDDVSVCNVYEYEDKEKGVLEKLIDAIDQFDKDCERHSYTDTRTARNILNNIKNVLKKYKDPKLDQIKKELEKINSKLNSHGDETDVFDMIDVTSKIEEIVKG